MSYTLYRADGRSPAEIAKVGGIVPYNEFSLPVLHRYVEHLVLSTKGEGIREVIRGEAIKQEGSDGGQEAQRCGCRDGA